MVPCGRWCKILLSLPISSDSHVKNIVSKQAMEFPMFGYSYYVLLLGESEEESFLVMGGGTDY